MPTSTSVPTPRGKTVWNRCQTGLWSMLRPVFGTAPLPTGTSVTSSRGEAVFNRRFGTATLPTGTPMPSLRGETIFCRHSCHETPAHRYSSAISSWRSSLLSVHSSMKWALFVDVEVQIGCSSMKWVLFVDVEVRSRCSAGPSPRPPCPQVLQWHPCKPRRLESQDNARDKGGGNDCVRCVGSGFDLALRDGVRIFE